MALPLPSVKLRVGVLKTVAPSPLADTDEPALITSPAESLWAMEIVPLPLSV